MANTDIKRLPTSTLTRLVLPYDHGLNVFSAIDYNAEKYDPALSPKEVQIVINEFNSLETKNRDETLTAFFIFLFAAMFLGCMGLLLVSSTASKFRNFRPLAIIAGLGSFVGLSSVIFMSAHRERRERKYMDKAKDTVLEKLNQLYFKKRGCFLKKGDQWHWIEILITWQTGRIDEEDENADIHGITTPKAMSDDELDSPTLNQPLILNQHPRFGV